jgi:hypothetical protein
MLRGQMDISISATDQTQAKWRRDVLAPKILKLMKARRHEIFHMEIDVEPVKRILS